MLSEISWTQKDIYCMISYTSYTHEIRNHVESEKIQPVETDRRVVNRSLGNRGWISWGDVDQRAQSFRYKINKFWRPNI